MENDKIQKAFDQVLQPIVNLTTILSDLCKICTKTPVYKT